jgi:hypothetical protein
MLKLVEDDGAFVENGEEGSSRQTTPPITFGSVEGESAHRMTREKLGEEFGSRILW